MASALNITAATVDPALLDLPWHLPLEDWPDENIAALPKGLSRHTVRFAHLSGYVIAIKETLADLAKREYDMLRNLQKLDVPCVEPFAIITNRRDETGEELPSVLITRHLKFSLPYRAMWSQGLRPETATRLVDALALLLVRLHIAGFFWGDVSLSNTLFRRDAGAFAAYLVDAETGEFQKSLSDGQREHDLEIAHFNVAAELEDLALSGVLYPGMDPIRASEAVIKRYHRIWKALKGRQVLDPKDRHAVERAMRQLHDLGFAVDEVSVSLDGESQKLFFQPKLVAPGYHRNRLRELTGLETEALQAKRLLASLDRFRGREENPKPPMGDSARRWLNETYRPIVEMIPQNSEGRIEEAQFFHEVLEHRWYLSEREGHDVGLTFAAQSYVADVMPFRSDTGSDMGARK